MKVLLLFAYTVAIFFVHSWWAMAAFVAVAVIATAVARIPVRRMMVPLIPIMVLAAFAVMFSFVSNPTAEGLIGGLFIAARMIVLVAASFVVCFTTTSSALLHAFSWFIGPLRALHVPVDDIAYTLSLALRFIPVVAEELSAVRMAQEARGGNVHDRGFMRKLHVWGSAFSAVFVGLFRHADALATAMDARCYGAAERRTSLHGGGASIS